MEGESLSLIQLFKPHSTDENSLALSVSSILTIVSNFNLFHGPLLREGVIVWCIILHIGNHLTLSVNCGRHMSYMRTFLRHLKICVNLFL